MATTTSTAEQATAAGKSPTEGLASTTTKKPKYIWKCRCEKFQIQLLGEPLDNVNCFCHSCVAPIRYLEEKHPGGLLAFSSEGGAAFCLFELNDWILPPPTGEAGSPDEYNVGFLHVGPQGKSLRTYTKCCNSYLNMGTGSNFPANFRPINRNGVYKVEEDGSLSKYKPEYPIPNLGLHWKFDDTTEESSTVFDTVLDTDDDEEDDSDDDYPYKSGGASTDDDNLMLDGLLSDDDDLAMLNELASTADTDTDDMDMDFEETATTGDLEDALLDDDGPGPVTERVDSRNRVTRIRRDNQNSDFIRSAPARSISVEEHPDFDPDCIEESNERVVVVQSIGTRL